MKRTIPVLLTLLLSAFTLVSQDFFTILNDGKSGIGTTSPSSELEVSSTSVDTDLRISSTCGFCSTRISFISDKGAASEWRPGYIKSGDFGGFAGRLDFFTNGIGIGNKFGNVHGMSVTNGRVGVNETNPATTLEVNGFTMLGDDAPKIKMKKLTGTTHNLDGGNVIIPHGIGAADKILAVNASVEYLNDIYVTANYEAISGYQFNVFYDNTGITIRSITGNSSAIVSKPVVILVTYEE